MGNLEKKIAIIDLGSNSIRLIIIKVYHDGSYKLIDQAKEMARLSEGMGEEKTLKPAAVKRALEALNIFKKLIDAHKVDQIIPVTTAAVRYAENQSWFLDKIRTETNLHFDVISGEEEAYYGYLGIINTIHVENALIMDIGGASTELVWVENRKMKEFVSIPYGTVLLIERFNGDTNSLLDFIDEELRKVSWLKEVTSYPVVGTGGTFRTLAKMHKKMTGFPLESLHNYQMNKDDVINALETLATMSLEERGHVPGISKERADIIVAGIALIKKTMEKIQSTQLTVSGSGLREGIFFQEYLKLANSKEPLVDDVLQHSIMNILKSYDSNIRHCYHVQSLALSLFDQTIPLHNLHEEDRRLLAISALLHDIGMYVDYYNHHKHGFYLALNSRLNGLSNRELVMCAFIIGMHRHEDFKEDWKHYRMLIDKYDFERVNKLSLMLRIAENLDRYGFGNVKNIACYITKDSLQIMLQTNNSPDLEINSVLKNEKKFAKMFAKKLVIV